MNPDVFPVETSILSCEALVERVLPHYPLRAPLTARLVHHGDNDTYLVTSARQPFMLRVWRHDARSRAEFDQHLHFLHDWMQAIRVDTYLAL